MPMLLPVMMDLPAGASSDATLQQVRDRLPSSLGAHAASAALPVVLASDTTLPLPAGASTEDTLAAIKALLPASLGAKSAALSLAVVPAPNGYETVAASQTAQVMGSTGATGDYLDRLVIIPASLNAGAVTLIDGATSISIFAGGTASLNLLAPFSVPLGLMSVNGPWKITTGASVSVIAIGRFT